MAAQDGWDSLTGRNGVFIAGVVSSLCFIALTSHYYFKKKFSYWTSRGLSGPEPWPLIGNMLQIMIGNRVKISVEWTRKYGKVYGGYFGVKPQLFVADADVMQQLCVKDFDVWTNHEQFPFSNKYQRPFLFLAHGDDWRRMRAIMSPTFTSGKIKRMFKILDKCADDLIRCCHEHLVGKKEAVVNMKELYDLYTLDGIASCCYGLKLSRVGTNGAKAGLTREYFVRIATRIFNIKMYRFILPMILPAKLLHYFGYEIVPESEFTDLASIISKMVKARRNSDGKKFDDYLQLLVDARIEQDLELNEIDSSENHYAGLTQESLMADQRKMLQRVKESNENKCEKNQLNDIEILSSAMILLAVGLETTSTALSNLAYVLAFHPEIQDRLYEEVKSVAERDGGASFRFEYEQLTTLKYLNAVVSESLRFITPATITDRVSTRDCRIEKYKLDISAGTKVNLMLHSLMNDPDYWEEPEKFNPDRFLPENRHKIVPGSYCPFGLGPRHCIGMRFSLTETKLALAKMIMKFRFEPAPKSIWPPVFNSGSLGVSHVKEPVVSLVPRLQ